RPAGRRYWRQRGAGSRKARTFRPYEELNEAHKDDHVLAMSRAAVGGRLERERRRDDVDHSRALWAHDREPGAPPMGGRPRASGECPGRALMRIAAGYTVGLERGAAGCRPAEP